MKTKTKKTVEIEITLSEDEAEYLKGMLQNYLGPGMLEDEDPHWQEIRVNMFKALKSALAESK